MVDEGTSDGAFMSLYLSCEVCNADHNKRDLELTHIISPLMRSLNVPLVENGEGMANISLCLRSASKRPYTTRRTRLKVISQHCEDCIIHVKGSGWPQLPSISTNVISGASILILI